MEALEAIYAMDEFLDNGSMTSYRRSHMRIMAALENHIPLYIPYFFSSPLWDPI